MNMTKERIMIEKQCFKNSLSSFCKKQKVMIKITNRREIKRIQKKLLSRLADQKDLIMSLCKLSSNDIALHAVSLEA